MFLALFPEQSAKMRLSTIFELLLILLLVAFAAYGRVIGEKNKLRRKMYNRRAKINIKFEKYGK